MTKMTFPYTIIQHHQNLYLRKEKVRYCQLPQQESKRDRERERASELDWGCKFERLLVITSSGLEWEFEHIRI